MKLIRNAITCKFCGDFIQSLDFNDLKYCSCKKVAVNGGITLLKRIGAKGSWEDRCIWFITDIKKAEEKFIIFSPNPLFSLFIAFDNQEDAMNDAKKMTKSHKDFVFYVVQLKATK